MKKCLNKIKQVSFFSERPQFLLKHYFFQNVVFCLLYGKLKKLLLTFPFSFLACVSCWMSKQIHVSNNLQFDLILRVLL